jgi:hypothetical protein
MAQTFEEWWANYPRPQCDKGPANDAWDAATYAANTRAGDAGNEAEKDARLENAMRQFRIVAAAGNEGFDGLQDPKLTQWIEVLIKEAQG